MKLPYPIITREHGSWAVLFVPMLVGIFYAGSFSLNNVYLACSALGVFMSYVPVHTILRDLHGLHQGREKIYASVFWGTIYLTFGILFIIPLFIQEFYHLITFAAIGAASFFGNYFLTIRGQKSILSDFIAVAGLTLSAPSAYYVASGVLDIQSLVMWVLNFLFFGCSVFYVHMKIRVVSLKKGDLSFSEKISLGKLNLVYHIAVVGIVIMLSLYNFIPQMVFAAFAPMIVHSVVGTIKLTGRVKFRKLGFLLLAQSFLFGLILIVLWS